MKLRQAQTSATYLLPDPGELDKRVQLRKRVDVPTADYGTEPEYPVSFGAWAKIVQTSATTYQETAQTDNAITHYITLRWRSGITSDFEVVNGDEVYRVNPEERGNPITYTGGTLLDVNRHELSYQFDFSVVTELSEDDTRQQDELNDLDDFKTLSIDVDFIDPGHGPDGNIEHHLEINLPS